MCQTENESAAMAEDRLVCNFCGAIAENSEAAMESGWLPSYWIGGEEITEPICAHCIHGRCRVNSDDGEVELIEDRPECGHIDAAINLLERAAHQLRLAEISDCEFAADKVDDLVSSDHGQAGLRKLLEILRAKGGGK